MGTPLLTTKLYIPPPLPNLVERSRLVKRLDEGLRPGHRLTLVSAPAGFGKTTLLSEWILTSKQGSDASLTGAGEQRRKIPPPHPRTPAQVAWLSLDESDNDPARFLAYFIAARTGSKGLKLSWGKAR